MLLPTAGTHHHAETAVRRLASAAHERLADANEVLGIATAGARAERLVLSRTIHNSTSMTPASA
jgi:hypothetical protein